MTTSTIVSGVILLGIVAVLLLTAELSGTVIALLVLGLVVYFGALGMGAMRERRRRA